MPFLLDVSDLNGGSALVERCNRTLSDTPLCASCICRSSRPILLHHDIFFIGSLHTFPNVIVFNSGDAGVLPNEPIIMGKKDVYEVYKAAPSETIIASRMEAVNHATLSRKDLRAFPL